MELQKVTFTVACSKYFGRLPGQSLADFSIELKNLTDDDKAELATLFPSVGFHITDWPKAVKA